MRGKLYYIIKQKLMLYFPLYTKMEFKTYYTYFDASKFNYNGHKQESKYMQLLAAT